MNSSVRWIIGAFVFLFIILPILRDASVAGLFWLIAVIFILWRVAQAFPREDRGTPKPLARLEPREIPPPPLPALGGAPATAPASPAATTEPSDGDVTVLERQLEALGQLRDRGMISDQEYEARRARAIAEF